MKAYNSPETVGLTILWEESDTLVDLDSDATRKDAVTTLDAALLNMVSSASRLFVVKGSKSADSWVT